MKSKQKHSARLHEPSSHKKLEETRVMNKSNGIVKAYSANTYQGLVRNYNEDRVSIILNISKPEHQSDWPKCSYFGVFDGHGGSLCSDFLRDNLHRFVIEDKNFPHKPVQALKNGFLKAENQFTKLAESVTPTDKSGSCAIIALIIDDKCYVANLGDSRAIVSRNKGLRISSLSIDHKPNSLSERQRIQKHGGTIYQSNTVTKKGQTLYGPYRIIPGRLSVSRAIGDIQAKMEKYYGNPNVLISEPEIKQFQFDQTHDFILLGCDGIFDKLSNSQIGELVWRARKESVSENTFLRDAVSSVIEESMVKKSFDNLTVVLILLECHDPIPKKSNSTTLIGPSIHRRELIDDEKLKFCSKQQLMRLSKVEQKRRPSFETNKQNTNLNNFQYTSNQISKPFPIESKQKQRSLSKIQDEKNSSQKQMKLKKRQSESRKLQFTKPENFGHKDVKGLMRF